MMGSHCRYCEKVIKGEPFDKYFCNIWCYWHYRYGQMGSTSDFEIWISKKKRGSREEFLEDYPKAKLHMKNLNHNISNLISAHKILQLGNDKFEWIGKRHKVKK